MKWGKVAKLNGLMKDEVPNINNKLKNSLRRFKSGRRGIGKCGHHGTDCRKRYALYRRHKKPAEGQKWTEFAAQMRSAAGDLAAKAHAGDEPGATAAMEKLNQSCHDCHAVFNPEKQP